MGYLAQFLFRLVSVLTAIWTSLKWFKPYLAKILTRVEKWLSTNWPIATWLLMEASSTYAVQYMFSEIGSASGSFPEMINRGTAIYNDFKSYGYPIILSLQKIAPVKFAVWLLLTSLNTKISIALWLSVNHFEIVRGKLRKIKQKPKVSIPRTP